MGVWNDAAFPPERSIMSMLQSLSRCKRVLIVHGNYLTEPEVKFISQHAQMHVVCCPRTHAFFKHSKHPLPAMRDRGINVAIGTDSRASNPDLRILEELKTLAAAFPELPRESFIEMGTRNGSIALGIEEQFGTVESGKSSRLCQIQTADLSGPFEWLRDPDSSAIPLG